MMLSNFELHEVKTREEFDAFVNVQWIGFQEPFRPHFPWLHPVYGYTEDDRVASIQKDADRRWHLHIRNPASHCFFVSDTATGQAVGAAEWQVNVENPFPNGPTQLECTWFPEGETRDFVTNFLNRCYYARMNWMDRPHISLNGMAVIPSMRSRGIATLLMRWGLEKAEELNLECFLEASDPGRDLYEKFDFRTLMTFVVNTHKKNPSPTWIRLQNQFPAASSTLMWRPKPKDLSHDLSFWDVLKGRSIEQD